MGFFNKEKIEGYVSIDKIEEAGYYINKIKRLDLHLESLKDINTLTYYYGENDYQDISNIIKDKSAIKKVVYAFQIELINQIELEKTNLRKKIQNL